MRVINAYHGYPYLIHRVTYRRATTYGACSAMKARTFSSESFLGIATPPRRGRRAAVQEDFANQTGS